MRKRQSADTAGAYRRCRPHRKRSIAMPHLIEHTATPGVREHTATLRLRAGDEATCRGLARRVLHIRGGAAWITQHHDTRDYVVAAGDEVHIVNDGPVIVHAIADVLVDVRRPEPARRLQRALQGALARLSRRPRQGAPDCPPAMR
jgi:hypothetical protein